MRIKDAFILTTVSLAVSWAVLESKPAVRDPLAWGELPQVDLSSRILSNKTQSFQLKERKLYLLAIHIRQLIMDGSIRSVRRLV